MRMICLGSGSSGNCYILENDTECLVIEAGVSLKEVKKAIDFNIKKIVGVVVSHIHKDHSKYISEYEKCGIPVFKPYESQDDVFMPKSRFMIRTFDLVHDVPCYGFHIRHPDIGSMVYATDTEYIKRRFKDVNHILVEANYDMQFVDKSLPNYEHVLKGHMSLDTTLKFISTNDNTALKNVVLLHLSQSNSDSDDFLKRTQEITNKNVYIAKKGFVVDLSLVPDWAK